MSKICGTCGAKVDGNASFCPSCGGSTFVVGADAQNINITNNNGNGVRCPRCGAFGCNMVSETQTKNKDFNAGNACCGYLLFGIEGILCGLCGTGSKTKTKNYWICPNCGNKFGA